MSYSADYLAHTPDVYLRLGDAGTPGFAGTMADSSGNARDAPYTSTTGLTFNQAGAIVGDPDGALLFSSGIVPAGNVPIVPYGSWMNRATFTALCWFKTSNTGLNYAWTRWGSSTASQVWALDLNTSDVVRGYSRIAGATRMCSATVTGLRDNNWHMMALSYDGAQLRLLVDGVLVSTVAIVGTPPAPASEGMRVGHRTSEPNGDNFSGVLDECGFGPLISDADITTLYETGLDLGPPDPVPVSPLTVRVLDAGHVDFNAVYNLSKQDRANQVVVTGPFTVPPESRTVYAADSEVPISLVIETDYTDDALAEYVGLLNINSDDSDRWTADEFTFYADLEPVRVTHPAELFNDQNHPLAQLAPCVISGIPASQNPTGGTWYAGQIVAATFVLERQRYRVRLKLRRTLPRAQIETDETLRAYLAYEDLEYVPVNIEDLDPAMSIFDCRLLRKA